MSQRPPRLPEHSTLINVKRCVMLVAILLLSGCAMVSGNRPYHTSASDEKLIDDAFDFPIANVPLITHRTGDHPVQILQIGFDGTMNDRDRVPPGEQPTITAKITSRLGGRYFPGPGMQSPHYRNFADGMFGYSSSAIAQQATDELLNKVEKLLDIAPDTEVRVFVTGFSRGAAIARHFMNLVDTKAQSSEKLRNHIYLYAMLFDTVSTGQTDKLDLRIPPSLDYLVHFVALDESRLFFTPFVDDEPEFVSKVINVSGVLTIPDRINFIVLPGAHSDIGGAYTHGIGAMYQQLSEELLFKMGLISQDCWDTPDHVIEDGKHDSRGVIDRLFGALAPNSKSVRSRAALSLPYHPLSLARVEENAYRLQAMSFANAARGSLIQRFKTTAQQPALTVRRDGDDLAVIAHSPYIDASTLTYNKTLRQLKFRYVPPYDATPYTMFLPDVVWRKIPDKRPVELAHRVLTRAGKQEVATFIDDVPVVFHGSFAVSQSLQRGRSSCRIGPDEIPRRTMEAIIISTNHIRP
ncbi:DUF2235 domain-containing protein [Pseudoduganella namucuonensis]|uniref:Uncharacterized alpha/beta hydrolase domain n=1 Tax=Pseudoduganella namucuonensis TaxID=1035707 RepID=A0A1I7M499_9BURK|nr:DUF2235 domain-containing protein [Pseudoduganella namucuonensis]SFV16791.1 Uncharacterized alpha/beta hydrolase domain [Pseudoduganella namucuonensis]